MAISNFLKQKAAESRKRQEEYTNLFSQPTTSRATVRTNTQPLPRRDAGEVLTDTLKFYYGDNYPKYAATVEQQANKAREMQRTGDFTRYSVNDFTTGLSATSRTKDILPALTQARRQAERLTPSWAFSQGANVPKANEAVAKAREQVKTLEGYYRSALGREQRYNTSNIPGKRLEIARDYEGEYNRMSSEDKALYRAEYHAQSGNYDKTRKSVKQSKDMLSDALKTKKKDVKLWERVLNEIEGSYGRQQFKERSIEQMAQDKSFAFTGKRLGYAEVKRELDKARQEEQKAQQRIEQSKTLMTQAYYGNKDKEVNALVEGARKDKEFWTRANEGKSDDRARLILDPFANNEDNARLQLMSDEEKATLYYYYATDKDKYSQLYKMLNEKYKPAAAQRADNEAGRFGEQYPATATGLRALMGPVSGLTSALNTAAYAVKDTLGIDYAPDIENDPNYAGSRIRSALGEGVTKAAEESAAKTFGDNKTVRGIASFLAQTGLSITDMAAVLPMGPASLYMMVTTAAGDSMSSAVQSGASPTQAIIKGSIDGAVEYFTEKLPIENLMKAFEEPTKSVRKTAIKQMLTEAGEEYIAEHANQITDILVMGDMSSYQQLMRGYKAQGMDESEARHKALMQSFVINPMLSAAGGAISGGVMGAGAGILGQAVAKANTGSPSVTIGTDAPVDTGVKSFMEKVSKRAGINIKVADIYDARGSQMSDAEGYYDRSTNTMVFAPQSTKADVIKGVVMHELTHSIEGGKFYGEYRDFAIRELYGNDTTAYMADINKKIAKYKASDVSLDTDGAERELVAEFTRNRLFNDEAAIDRLVSQKPNLAVRVYESVRDAIERVKAYFKDGEGQDKQSEEYKQLQTLEQGRKLFEKALDNRGVERSSAGIQSVKTEMQIALEKAGVDSSIFENAEKDTPDVQYSLYTDPENQEIKSSETSINSAKLPAVFNRIEFKPGTMNLDIGGGKFDNATEYLKAQGVTNYIYDPYNRTQEHNTEVAAKTENGQSDTVTISNVLNVIKEKEARQDVLRNAVDALKPGGEAYITVYEGNRSGEGKETTKGYQLNMKLADYVPEVSEFFNEVTIRNGVIIAKNPIKKDTPQMSIKDPSTAGATPDTIQDAKREWAEKGTDSKYFKKWFGDSKVVDENGKPLVVYHGTDKEFSYFDITESRSYDEQLNYDLPGAYFSENKEEASGYGDVGEYYLSIKNPYKGDYVALAKEKGSYRKAYDYLVASGYDGVIETDMGEGFREFIVFSPNQVKSATDNIGTFDGENHDIRYSIKEDNPDGTSRSEFYENTIKRAKAIPQEVKDKLNPESFDFIPESSKEWQTQAEKNVSADMEGTIKRIEDAPSIRGGIEAHEAAVIAKKLVDKFKKSGSEEDFRAMQDFLKTVAAKTRESARALKATDTAWDKTDPAAAVIRAERTVQKATEAEKKVNPKKYADGETEQKMLGARMKNAEQAAKKASQGKELTAEQLKEAENARKKKILENWVKDTVPRGEQKTMMEKIMEMHEAGAYDDPAIARLVSEKRGIPYLDSKEMKSIIEHIENANKAKEGGYEQRMELARADAIVEGKLPVSFRDKIKAFPRISILTGTRTQVRNIVGNVIHGTYEAARENTVGLIADIIASKATGQRQISGNVLGKSAAYWKGFSTGISEWYRDIKNGVDTAPTKTRGEIKRNTRTFKSAVLNAIDAVVKQGLTLGDRPFYQGAYEARFYELSRLNKKNGGKKTAGEIAIEAQLYALDKVFQNDSTVKNVASRLRNLPSAIENPFWQGAAEVGMTLTMPFTETPANIFDKALENSPIGLAKAALELGKTKKGTFDQLKFVQNLSRGLTGTGLMVLGAMLFKKGLISIEPWDEDYDKYKFMQSIGLQNYALRVGNKYYSLSWVEPIATPLLVGSEMARGSKDNENILDTLFGTAQIGIDSFFEASFVQGLSELFGSGSVGEGVKKKLLDSPDMFIPLSAFSKSLAQWADPYMRETRDDSDLKQMLKEKLATIPFASKKLPVRVDAFGNEVMVMDGKNTVFNVFFNPANVTEYKTTAVHDEIVKLYDETNSVTMFPDYISKTEVKYNKTGVNLKDNQLEAYKKKIGSRTYEEYEKVMATAAYKKMAPEEKVEALANAKEAVKKQVNFETVRDNADVLTKAMSETAVYNAKTQIALDKAYANRWAKLTPDDDNAVFRANSLSSISEAVNAFGKEGKLNEKNAAKIMDYINNKKPLTLTEQEMVKLYRETGSRAVFNNSYDELLKFTLDKKERVINIPEDKLPDIIAESDNLVVKAYTSVVKKGNWKYLNADDKLSALSKAKRGVRKAYENHLKKKYGYKLKK